MSKGRKTACALGCMYAAALLWILFLRRIGVQTYERTSNFRPFDTIGRYITLLFHARNRQQLHLSIVNLAGNLILFLPWGIFLPALFAPMRRYGTFFLCTAATVCAVEACQGILRLGVCDVDDVILNICGAAMGWLLWRLICTFYRKKRRHRTNFASRT